MAYNKKISRAATAHYLSEMITSMRLMAEKEDMNFLVYLLEMAYMESKELERQHKSS